MVESFGNFEATGGSSTLANFRDYGGSKMLSPVSAAMRKEKQKMEEFKNLPKMLVVSAVTDHRTFIHPIQRFDNENVECHSFSSAASNGSNLNNIANESSSVKMALGDSEFSLVPDGSISTFDQECDISISHMESDDFYYNLLATMNQLDFAKRHLEGRFCCNCGFMHRTSRKKTNGPI